jgi:tRNA/rRNA methyltransferase
MSFSTYILRCANGAYYTGHTDDLEQRVSQHQAGVIKGYTHDKRPLELVWSAAFATSAEALSAEIQIKGWSRKKKEALIAENWDRLKSAAISHGDIARDKAATSLGSCLRLRSRRTEKEAVKGPAGAVGNNIPLIILVRPQLGENIGKAARAMLNFGLIEMRLVAPRDGWPNPDAGPAAAGANIVLERARVFDTLGEAVADCAHVYATTVRKRGVTKPVVTPEEAAREIHAAQGRSAFVFGPERSGLETDDVAIARKIITVPINPEFGSLNLAQAVILCAYEWSKGQALASPTVTDLGLPAPQEELDGMIGQLEAMLDKAGYFYPLDRTPATKRVLRNVLTKPGWNSQEVRTLRGIWSTLADPHER